MLRRKYIETTDVSGATEDQVALAEYLIDEYIGYHQRFFSGQTFGKVSSVSSKTIFDTNSDTQLNLQDDFFKNCVIEIIGGTGTGQSRVVTSSDRDNHSVTYEGTTFSPNVDTTSVFKIYQLAKFPRFSDVHVRDETYYKAIPQALREAVIAQTQYVIDMGDDFFSEDSSEMVSETFSKYSYTRDPSLSRSVMIKFIAPKARTFLRGLVNRKATLIRDNPTWL